MRVFLIACTLLAAVGSAHAADPSPASVPAPIAALPSDVAAPYSWAGFYLRGSGDLDLGLNATDAKALSPRTSNLTGNSLGSASGGMGGGLFGANWQSGDAVFGVQGDMQWNSERAAAINSCDLGCSLNERVRVPWLATLRARAGTAFDNVFVYGTGGFATKGTSQIPDGGGFDNAPSFDNISAGRIDWTVGGGLEVALDRNLSAKLEYLYMPSSGPPGAPGSLFDSSAEASKNNIVRGGIDYRLSIGQ
jgi:outer membrane immunogenic protein